MDSYILGFDPGTTCTGFAVITLDLKLVDYGCIRPPSKDKLSNRYLIIYNAVAQLIAKYPPHSVAVETQFVGRNPASALKLGIARGMVLLPVTQNQVPLFEYAPTKAKLAATGNGKASKGQVQKMIQLLFNLPKPPEPEDAADALAIAVAHVHALKSNRLLGIEV